MFEKHEKFMSRLAELQDDWGLTTRTWPEAKDPFTEHMEIVNLRKCFRKEIYGAEVQYQNRKYLIDHPQYDDFFMFEFNPKKLNYGELVNDIFQEYIGSFGAYVGEIHDQALIHLDFDAWRQSGINERSGVFRFYPVCFFDQELCSRAFQLTPNEVAARVSDNVEGVKLVSNGVLIVASSKIVSIDGANEIDRKLKSLLPSKASGQVHQATEIKGDCPGPIA